jgi:hypothetical protein
LDRALGGLYIDRDFSILKSPPDQGLSLLVPDRLGKA